MVLIEMWVAPRGRLSIDPPMQHSRLDCMIVGQHSHNDLGLLRRLPR